MVTARLKKSPAQTLGPFFQEIAILAKLVSRAESTLSRVRDGSINFEIAEDTTFGHLQQQIKFLAGGSLFVLSVTDLPPTPRYLALDQIHSEQLATGYKKPTKISPPR